MTDDQILNWCSQHSIVCMVILVFGVPLLLLAAGLFLDAFGDKPHD